MAKVRSYLKRIFIVFASLVLLALAIAFMSGTFREKIEPGTVEPERRRLSGEPTDIVHEIVETELAEVVGTLRAVTRTRIAPKILATITEISVRAGDSVETGHVLVRLDDRDLRAGLEKAKQAVIASEADLKNAQSDFERYRGLVEQNVVSSQEFEQREARFKVSQAELEQAREGVSAAETALSHSVIQAPAAGIVVDKLAEAGDTAIPGKALLVIYDPKNFRLEAAVPEVLAASVAVGDSLGVSLDVLDLDLNGTVEEIVPQAEAATRSVLVKVHVPRSEGMVEGMFGRLLIPSRERVRLCVPQSAIKSVGQLRFADVVTDGDILERRQIKLGEHAEAGRVEVISGLNAGERVALYGPPPEPFPVEGVRIDRSQLP